MNESLKNETDVCNMKMKWLSQVFCIFLLFFFLFFLPPLSHMYEYVIILPEGEAAYHHETDSIDADLKHLTEKKQKLQESQENIFKDENNTKKGETNFTAANYYSSS